MRANASNLTSTLAGALSAWQRAPQVGAAPRREIVWLLCIALAFGLGHAIGTWRHISVYWGDYGYILDLIARAHAGDVPYRDFHWGYPPLSIWVMGGLTRLFGIDLAGMWTATAAVYCAIIAAFVWYVRLVAPASSRALIACTALLLAVALANLGSAPLPLGTYSPAAPIGFVALLVGWCATLRFLVSPHARWALLASTAAGLAVLSKHDFWIASAYLVGVCAASAWFTRSPKGRSLPLMLSALAPATAVVAAGLVWIAIQSDRAMVWDMLRGFGLAEQQAFRGSPTLEILTIHLMLMSALMAVVAAALQLSKDREARRWNAAGVFAGVAAAALVLWMVQAFRIAVEANVADTARASAQLQAAFTGAPTSVLGFARFALQTLIERAPRHVLPILLPVCVGVALAAGRPRRLSSEQRMWFLLLLGFALTLRVRRLFEFTEWFVVLIELPVYAAILYASTPQPSRSRSLPVRVVAIAVALFGVVTYYKYARGALTERGRMPLTWSPRGYFRSGQDPDGVRRVTTTLERLDPTGRRPLFSFGYSNGFNYFTARPYPAATPIGFRTTARARPDSTVRAVLASEPPAIVIDGPFWDEMTMPKPGFMLWRWDRPIERPSSVAQQRRDFQPILDKCRFFARLGAGPRAFAVYDCAQPALVGRR